MQNKVFISYSTRDTKKVKKIHDDLVRAGHIIWIYPHAIDPGEDILKSEVEGIRDSDFVLLMLSNNYSRSEAAQKEILFMRSLERKTGINKLIYIRISGNIPLKHSKAIQICDLSKDKIYVNEFHRLLVKMENHKNFTIDQTISRYKMHKGWYHVKLEVSKKKDFIREVDYHLHPDLAHDVNTIDNSTDIQNNFSISFDTNDNELVYVVVWLNNGDFEEIRHFVTLR